MTQKLLVSLILFFILASEISDAQQRRNTYQDLLMRSDQAGIYVDHHVLPDADGGSFLAVAFRMDYDLLPFRRVRASEAVPDSALEFTAVARMNLDVFQDEGRQSEFNTVSTDSWVDTAWASSYEVTRSRHNHLEGFMNTPLDPGSYRFMLQLNRGETTRENRSSQQTFTVPERSDSDAENGVILLAESVSNSGPGIEFKWMNFGNNILYGQDYSIVLVLPENTDPESTLNVRIHRLEPGSDSEMMGEPLFEEVISASDMTRSDGFVREEDRKAPHLSFQSGDEGVYISILTVPNRQFPNDQFRISVSNSDEEEPILTRNVYSRWIDMPVSLLNMDVAVNMLRFIVDESTLRDLNRGSVAERERRFRAFWGERDPTPETEYNELMAEYYRRIDQAYQQFTTPQQPGFESDQGRAFIQMGPPNRKERTFPVDSPTRELWFYDNQTLVFEATSGFGDFRLIGSE
ncbi:MAG: GWxTD domain-containing protein [Balneolaceae bacterium]